MSVATSTAPSRPRTAPSATLGTARTTGLLYLALALAGLAGFLILRPQVFTDEAAATVAKLVEHESVARLVVALELGVVVAQALVAVWFYRLFRSVDAVAAGALAAFGLVNATAILVSAASLATALELALDPIGDATGQVHLLIGLSDNLWVAGGLFFGLWLVPNGCARAPQRRHARPPGLAARRGWRRLRPGRVRDCPRSGGPTRSPMRCPSRPRSARCG